MTFGDIIKHTLKFEGGFVDNPNDRGGRTNFGITQKTLDSLKDPSLPKDVKDLTEAQATAIYHKFYWEPLKADQLPFEIRSLLFDQAVNSGVSGAVKRLQKILNLTPDGSIGPNTIAATWKTMPPAKLRDEYFKATLDHYARIVSSDSSQAQFLRGWLRRAANIFLNA